MPEYLNVPVPQELVPEVMRLISDRLAMASASSPEINSRQSQRGLDGRDQRRNWTREQFEEVYASKASSLKLFCDVLSVLAEHSPSPMTHDAIAQELGVVDGLTIQKTFAGVTRWLRNRWGGDPRWPFVMGPGTWALNEHNKALWNGVSGANTKES